MQHSTKAMTTYYGVQSMRVRVFGNNTSRWSRVLRWRALLSVLIACLIDLIFCI